MSEDDFLKRRKAQIEREKEPIDKETARQLVAELSKLFTQASANNRQPNVEELRSLFQKLKVDEENELYKELLQLAEDASKED